MLYRLNIQNSKSLAKELARIDCDPRGIKIMQEKLAVFTLKLTDFSGFAGLILKEEALSAGADCAIPRWTIRDPNRKCSALLLLNKKQLRSIISKLSRQAFRELRELAVALKKYLIEPKNKLPIIMGILNITPDSFSDGGAFIEPKAAIKQALAIARAGAKIIDIGGESTRPGAKEISSQEELNRVIPVIKALHKAKPNLTISIDTTKSDVAEAAIKAGATMINDISGLTHDPKIAKIAAKYKTKLVLMHRSGNSKTMQQKTEYADPITDILTSLQFSCEKALAAGVKPENIIIDPGIGFGKTTEHNLYLIQQLGAFKSLDYPVLLGASRKSVIGNTLKRDPNNRLSGTIAASIAALGQTDYLRVHDVTANLDALKMYSAIQKG